MSVTNYYKDFTVKGIEYKFTIIPNNNNLVHLGGADIYYIELPNTALIEISELSNKIIDDGTQLGLTEAGNMNFSINLNCLDNDLINILINPYATGGVTIAINGKDKCIDSCNIFVLQKLVNEDYVTEFIGVQKKSIEQEFELNKNTCIIY